MLSPLARVMESIERLNKRLVGSWYPIDMDDSVPSSVPPLGPKGLSPLTVLVARRRKGGAGEGEKEDGEKEEEEKEEEEEKKPEPAEDAGATPAEEETPAEESS